MRSRTGDPWNKGDPTGLQPDCYGGTCGDPSPGFDIELGRLRGRGEAHHRQRRTAGPRRAWNDPRFKPKDDPFVPPFYNTWFERDTGDLLLTRRRR